jgi:hypothetical protein
MISINNVKEYISLADDSEIEVPKIGSVKIKMYDG